MLTDAQVERYSRQIILPEVGARGQERLLAARVALGGDPAASALVAMLLGRAGVGVLDADPTVADVVVHVLDDGVRLAATPRPVVVAGPFDERLVVATLLGRPCARCFDWHVPEAAAVDTDPAARLALAALAAAEVLRVLLTAPAGGRCTTLRWADGKAEAIALAPTAGCEACR